MANLTREQAVAVIQNDWATYVACFQRLSPASQAEFLTRQGYASLASLLAHILAWWEEGQRVIIRLRDNPGVELPDYDVDAFNADAVARYRSWSEPAMLAAFEQARLGWVSFIENLPASAFHNRHIVHRLYLEIVFHMQEHLLPSEM